jgi:anti-anti-sigma factor
VTIGQKLVAGQTVFLVAGRMDAENSPDFEQKCRARIAEGLPILIVDLGELAYVSSMGLRSFIAAMFRVCDSVESALLGG